MTNRFKQKEEVSPEVKEFTETRKLTSVKEIKGNTDFNAIQKKEK